MHPRSSQGPPGQIVLSRRERKKERTRQEIHGAAMKLFTRSGYDAVTIEAICDAADVARGTFFLHFPTKAALLTEFGRDIAAQFVDGRDEARGSARDELLSLCELLSARWIADAEIMGPMLREFIASADSPAAPGSERDGGLVELIEEIVRRGQELGEFNPGLHPRLAVAVFLSTSAAILSGAVYDANARPEQVRDQFLEAVLHGLENSLQRTRAN